MESTADRRRPDPDSVREFLERLPALVLLQRLPVPALATDEDGVIVHANPALERMLGYDDRELHGRSITEFVAPDTVTDGAGAVARLHDFAGKVIDLTHRDGYQVRAAVSRSELRRQDEPITLVCFQDVTESLWGGGNPPDFC